MSLNSGIQVSKNLSALIAKPYTSITIGIVDECFVALSTTPIDQTFEDCLLEINSTSVSPCYVAISSNTATYLILFLQDTASVRNKMLYSSSKQLLAKGLDCNTFYIRASLKSEFTLEGIQAFHKSAALMNPLTERERVAMASQLEEASAGISLSSRKGTSALSFPLSKDAITALHPLESLVILQIKDEITILVAKKECTFEEIVGNCPSGPCFLFYNLNGKVIFAFISPAKTPIKDRVCYAGSRQSLLGAVEQYVGTIDKKVELDDLNEFQMDLFVTVAAPPNGALKFSKPVRPGRR